MVAGAAAGIGGFGGANAVVAELEQDRIMRCRGFLIGTVASLLWASEAFAEQACYTRKGEEAIAACTRDIENLSTPRERAVAYNDRGDAYRAIGKSDLAIADFGEAIGLDPKYAHAYYNRGNVYGDDKGDLSRAIADFSEAIRLNPYYIAAYFSRARAYLYSGDAVQALPDIERAAALNPKDAYSALWFDNIAQRNNVPSRLAQSISTIDMTVWPAPVIELYLGRQTQAGVLSVAGSADGDKRKGLVCEANFYGGELALRKKDSTDEAVRLLRSAATDCPPEFTESLAAKAELKALGVAP
jgi:lipoprotein NlpI